jgi:hypothetical protein
MRTLVGFGISLLLASGLFAQFRRGLSQSPFGNVVFPGGIASSGNVVFPGGGGPQFVVPGSITDPTFGMRLAGTVAGSGFRGRPSGYGTRRTGTVVMYGYPVYVGGYVDNAYPAEAAPQQQQPNITVIYPPQPAPVIINRYGSDDAQNSSATTTPAAERQPVEEPPSTNEPSHYLIAFKDHTVYSAVAYWVDGDTLHYFTSGNTHNQVSLSLIDRDLTQRLNKESGLEVELPPAK